MIDKLFKYLFFKNVFVFFMLVGIECDLLCGLMCFLDFDMCIFILVWVNMGICNRFED